MCCDAPKPPDPAKTAAAQAQANKEGAIASQELNMVNQYTPYGSLTYDQRGTSKAGTPQYSATTTLAPDQQRMLDLSNQAGIGFGEVANTQLGNVRGALSSPVNFGSFGALPQANEATRQSVADSLYGRLEPLMNRDEERMRTRLKTQGINEGTEAWRAAMDDAARARNDARLSVENQALSQMGPLYGLEQAARNAGINEMVQQRQIPINELMAMLSGAQVQGPNFVNTPQANVAPADITGPTYANYQARVNNQNALLGGLFGLGSAGLGAYGMSQYGV